MAHELSIEDGRASMMYVGTPPWHGLGTRLDGPATAAQAIEAAGLNWEVELVPLHAVHDRQMYEVAGQFAVVRKDRWGTDKNPVLGAVSRGYVPLQNRDAFRFFDEIVGDGKAIYHTAGALFDGRKIWILAMLPGEIRVAGDDVAEKYLLLSNGHDGRTSVQVTFTPVRVVCNNTLTIALQGADVIKVHHRYSMQRRLAQVPELLGIISNKYDELEQSFQAMGSKEMTTEQARAYLESVFAMPDTPAPATIQRVLTERKWSLHFFEHGQGNDAPGVRGTLWAAYNGVTEWVDHKQRSSADQRMNTVCLGRGLDVKRRAYEVALRTLKGL